MNEMASVDEPTLSKKTVWRRVAEEAPRFIIRIQHIAESNLYNGMSRRERLRFHPSILTPELCLLFGKGMAVGRTAVSCSRARTSSGTLIGVRFGKSILPTNAYLHHACTYKRSQHKESLAECVSSSDPFGIVISLMYLVKKLVNSYFEPRLR